MFINVAAVISKYCFPENCNLATSVSCMQMIKVKITACEMYWNWLTSTSCTCLSDVKSATVVQLILDHD